MNQPRLNPALFEVPLYIAGRSVEEVQEELGLEKVIKLASNESPVGPSPKAVAAATAVLSQAHRYPGVLELRLRKKLADQLGGGLGPENIVTANGGTDALRMITQAFVFDGGNTVMSRTTFPMYRILTAAFGGEARQVAPGDDYHHDLDAMADQVDEDTRLVFLCSPNNPTGHIITQDEADRFMARIPERVVVVFDESYREYVTAEDHVDSLTYIREGRNVFVVHSFSKSAGLANMRVGYLVGPAELSDYVRRTQLPFHTGDIALAAAMASLDDHEYLGQHVQAVIAGRNDMYEQLCRLSLRCYPSQANFLALIDPPLDPPTLTEALLQHGFIVRPMAAFGLANAIRVSVGTPAENRAFIQALQEILATASEKVG